MCQPLNDQRYSALLVELFTGPYSESYWARKSKMHSLQWELSPLDYKLIEFDVSFKYSQAKDLAKSAKRIFEADKSNEKVRQRIGQLFSVLLNTLDKEFSTELVNELGMEDLHEMFFYAFPEQRNSTKGSLQVYLLCANNQPQSLSTIATKLFAYYLGASAEFQMGQKGKKEEITPMDAVIFYIFDSLVQANFGDLSEHNIAQIFQIILANCFADTMGRLAEDFYSQSSIPCLSGIDHPSQSWHFCFPILSQLLQKRQKPDLANSLGPFPASNAKISQSLEKALASDSAPELLKNAEFVRFSLCWAMASPIRSTQNDPSKLFICVPANIFWVDPNGLEHFWVYNLDAEEEDSPAEIEEEGAKMKTMRIDAPLSQPIRLLNSIFSAGPEAERELANLGMPNAHSIALMALMASQNWKRAAELAKHFESLHSFPDSQKFILRLQKLQIQIALRQLPHSFALCLDLLANSENDGFEGDLAEFPAQIVSQEPHWVQLASRPHIPLFLRLLLFHICWLAFAKFHSSAKMQEKGGELFFLCLILLAQSCWPQFGFGLFQQLADHIANKDRFKCGGLLPRLNNPILIGHLLGLDHVLMNLSAQSEENYQNPAEIFEQIIEGKEKLGMEKSANEILREFLEENGEKMKEMLHKL